MVDLSAIARSLKNILGRTEQGEGFLGAITSNSPELLVLDEPTTGLDPLMQEEFLSILGEERDRGATVFLSSHDLDEVQRACDRVGIIRDGHLIAVEDVAAMRERAYRIVTLEFASPVDPAEFARLPGVTDLQRDGARLTFHAQGGLDAVVKAAARHELEDLEVSRPTLEELFLTYYRHEAAA